MDFSVKKIIKEEILSEHKLIGFDESYVQKAQEKHNFITLKIFDLTLPQANILKQTSLSIGAECSLNKGVLINSVDRTDAILSGSIRQIQNIAKKLTCQQFHLKDLANELMRQIRIQTTQTKPVIVGILNVTPDSFSDGGKYLDETNAIKHSLDMIEAGAEIIDIGGESTAPNNKAIDYEIECKRVIPIILKLKKYAPNIQISIDTRNSETAKEAIAAGADIINDVSGFNWDEKIVDIALKFEKKYVLTHSIYNNSEILPENTLGDFIDNLYLELKTKSDFLLSKGFKRENIIVDPGFGFNKNEKDNYLLLKRMPEFTSLGYEIMAGTSRKRFLQSMVKNPENLDILTSQTTLFLALCGVKYIRVHNVETSNIALKLYSKLAKN